MEQDDEDWYGRSRSIGMGGRQCRNVQPISVLVRHRCPCTHASCKEEARLVEELNHKVASSAQCCNHTQTSATGLIADGSDCKKRATGRAKDISNVVASLIPNTGE